MATTPVMMSVEEYLHTEFRPDCDYVDGLIEERNLGELEHGRLQGVLYRLLGDREGEWGVEVVFETRVQVSERRFRVPDVCVLDSRLRESRIIRQAPLLCIEVLSPEDRFPRVIDKIQDYHAMGVGVVWVFDPDTKQVWVSDAGTVTEHRGGVLRVAGTAIELALGAVFARLVRPREGSM